jgi:hypothetical protein
MLNEIAELAWLRDALRIEGADPMLVIPSRSTDVCRPSCQLSFFFGTFAPFFLASERPMAIACFLLVTFLPLPLRSVPAFFLFIALRTVFEAPFEYFAITLKF